MRNHHKPWPLGQNQLNIIIMGFTKCFSNFFARKKPPHFCQFSKITREPIIAGMQRNKKIGIISQFRKNFFSLSPFRRSSFFPEFAESIRSGIQRGRAGHGRQQLPRLLARSRRLHRKRGRTRCCGRNAPGSQFDRKGKKNFGSRCVLD